jgi:hypothetical protein
LRKVSLPGQGSATGPSRDGWAALGRIEEGALASREFSISRGVVTIHDAGRTIQIEDPDIECARELAETFIEV